jgi:hypothetical protein
VTRLKPAAILLFFASAALAQNDADFVKSVLSARVVELNFVWDKNAPVLTFNPLRIQGATASPLNAFALLP